MYVTVGAAGFFLDSAKLGDSRLKEHYEAKFEQQWSIGLPSSGSMLGIGIRKSLIIFGCITERLYYYYSLRHDH